MSCMDCLLLSNCQSQHSNRFFILFSLYQLALQVLAAGAVRSLFIFFPFIAFQTYGYSNICLECVPDQMRPWCKARLPLLYNYIQSHYWYAIYIFPVNPSIIYSFFPNQLQYTYATLFYRKGKIYAIVCIGYIQTSRILLHLSSGDNSSQQHLIFFS